MKKFWTNLKDVCYSKEAGLKKGMTLSVVMVLAGLATMGWFLIRLLKYEGHWNPDHYINLTDAGLIGDFIGGLSGTLFALVGVLLLFETLSLQRNEFAESRKVFEKQQFDNTFFNLINLYNEIVKSLHDDTNKFIGKLFFENKRKEFYNSFTVNGNFTKARRDAKIKYIEFYTSTKEQTANYFRTIYRIFRFISSSGLSSEEKMSYAKIVRAQLSESELFFIYYNAYSEYGAKFRPLINEFNILKHLPTLEKAEFKDYAGKLQQIQKNSVGLVLEDLVALIKYSLTTQKMKNKVYLQGAISISVSSNSPSNFEVSITKRQIANIPISYQQGFGLTNFDVVKTTEFFDSFLHEIIHNSNYLEFNRGVQILYCAYSNINNNKHSITLTVNNLKLNSIKL